ncbi:signal transduction histidine kinase (STHK), LytS [Chamaesiphon sp.]|uniref:signal transduction histidine kinase (STHK), LytS n=1 Tax=Chamaesiphon sp. TaxID=2814140 RepID=UPI003593AC69
MALAQKNAVGIFPNREQIESALERLKAADFPMDNVSVVAPDGAESAPDLAAPVVESEQQFDRQETAEHIGRGVAGAGAVGSAVGGVIAGLTTLAFPAFSGAVVLAGMAAGAFYGAVSGGVLGGGIGSKITEEKIQHYRGLVTQGSYLAIVKGTDLQISQAESILKSANIQDWLVFDNI